MTNNMKRRVFLKGSMAAGAVGIAVGAGLLTPTQVLARTEPAFKAKTTADGMSSLMGSASAAASGDIKIKAPDIAENGAVVPVTVTAGMDGVESIAIFADKNPTPLAAAFNMGSSAEGYVSTRIKMGKTGNVVAVVKAGGKLYTASKEVKVTIGGCGG